MFSLEFKGLCSHNKLNLYIIWIYSIVAALLAYFCLVAEKEVESGEDNTSWKSIALMTVIICGLPMLITFISAFMLVHNLCCDKQYEHMAVWHRNSLFSLLQVLIFTGFLLSSFIRLLTERYSDQNLSL